MKPYDITGYVNIRGILASGYPFIFCVGGRGVGKTYTALKTCTEDRRTFMLMRRTQSQCDLISKPEFSVFKPLNQDLSWDIRPERISKYNSSFVRYDTGEPYIVGYSCALSTLSNMRGFDASNIEALIYDEFIPEPHERLLKNEAPALFNAYETMNRNRELKGKPPIQLLCLANANDITNPVFEYLNLISVADKMQKRGSEVWTDDKRGIMLVMLSRSPISKAKSNTALYKLTQGTDFSNMSLNNDFNVSRTNIKPRPLQEYIPVCRIGELCIYKHKSNRRLYASTHSSGVFKNNYLPENVQILHYQSLYSSHYDYYVSGKIDFESVLAEKLFCKYWDFD